MASTRSVEYLEINKGSASEYQPEGSDHGADVDAQSDSDPPYVAPRVPSIDCPSEILAEFAQGPFDPKSPLK